jgi:hypothetical protein
VGLELEQTQEWEEELVEGSSVKILCNSHTNNNNHNQHLEEEVYLEILNNNNLLLTKMLHPFLELINSNNNQVVFLEEINLIVFRGEIQYLLHGKPKDRLESVLSEAIPHHKMLLFLLKMIL